MTDDSATLRAMAEWLRDFARSVHTTIEQAEQLFTAAALLASQSSWAKEKEEMERQLAEMDRLVYWLQVDATVLDDPTGEQIEKAAIERHASRSETEKD